MLRLLVLRPGAIGDSLLAFPVLQVVRERYKEENVHITFVSNSTILPLAMACRLADEIFDYDNALWSELFFPEIKPAQRLYTLLQTIDMAICWLRDSDAVVEQNLHRVGIKHVVVAPGRPPVNEHIHIVDYLFQTLAMPTKKSYEAVRIFPSTVQTEERRAIAVHPGSGGAQKCWPVSCFVALIKELWRANLPVLLLAGPADHERLEELLVLLQQFDGINKIRRGVGLPRLRFPEEFPPDENGRCKPTPPRNGESSQSGLLETLLDVPLLVLAQHLQQCRAYIGNDSGITHLAAMLGVPTIALFGPSDPAIWHPIGPSVHVLHEPQLQNLRVDTVVDTMKTILLK